MCPSPARPQGTGTSVTASVPVMSSWCWPQELAARGPTRPLTPLLAAAQIPECAKFLDLLLGLSAWRSCHRSVKLTCIQARITRVCSWEGTGGCWSLAARMPLCPFPGAPPPPDFAVHLGQPCQ